MFTTIVTKLIAALAAILPLYFTYESINQVLSEKGRRFLSQRPEILLTFVYGSAFAATGDAVITFVAVAIAATVAYTIQTSDEVKTYFKLSIDKEQTPILDDQTEDDEVGQEEITL